VYHEKDITKRAQLSTTNIVSDYWYAGVAQYGKLGFTTGTPEANSIKTSEYTSERGECRLASSPKNDRNRILWQSL